MLKQRDIGAGVYLYIPARGRCNDRIHRGSSRPDRVFFVLVQPVSAKAIALSEEIGKPDDSLNHTQLI